ncbi:MAG: hypothetical protein AAB413_03480 [Patescibacteria group bacterium]
MERHKTSKKSVTFLVAAGFSPRPAQAACPPKLQRRREARGYHKIRAITRIFDKKNPAPLPVSSKSRAGGQGSSSILDHFHGTAAHGAERDRQIAGSDPADEHLTGEGAGAKGAQAVARAQPTPGADVETLAREVAVRPVHDDILLQAEELHRGREVVPARVEPGAGAGHLRGEPVALRGVLPADLRAVGFVGNGPVLTLAVGGHPRGVGHLGSCRAVEQLTAFAAPPLVGGVGDVGLGNRDPEPARAEVRLDGRAALLGEVDLGLVILLPDP